MKVKIIEISHEELESVIRKAFRLGELWGVSYSTWYEPTQDEAQKEFDNCLKECLASLTGRGMYL